MYATSTFLYNSINNKKEQFIPIQEPYVGMYVCGPTVYSDSHLGHARSGITFDLLFRYLKYLNYNVRYVRNITDVGHLENEIDDVGDDKIEKKAKLYKIEPMEVVNYYLNSYHQNMNMLNILSPSIEPHASGHIIEQISFIEEIIKSGFAYESNGSVYFDLLKYNEKFNYGKLSGRKLDNLFKNTRSLNGQSEKKNNFDFALWKKADSKHIMKWSSKWGFGFPGWHIECSAMSAKYLGQFFDIHGGGMDLIFPHHECEIAQSNVVHGYEPAKYWIHNNMITINGQKMSRSAKNFITLNELFNGNSNLLPKTFNPMTIRFFILQSHYRNTIDFSFEALLAAEKGFKRIFNSIKILQKLKTSEKSTVDINVLWNKCFNAINDDLNTPEVIANLYDGVNIINMINNNIEKISNDDLNKLKTLFNIFIFDILGFKIKNDDNSDDLLKNLINFILNYRHDIKLKNDFDTSDYIRSELLKLGIIINDTKNGFDWYLK